MHVLEVTHRTTGYNGGGFTVDVGLVGRGGRGWSMEEASKLLWAREAVFLYRGERLTDLSILPRQP
jgi:hypothetical protein